MESSLQLWLGFAIGLLVRWGDRIQYVVAEDPEHTIAGYARHNYIRLLVRVLSSAAMFYYVILPTGWVVAAPIAFSIGLSFDTMAESFLDRAKKTGEQVMDRLKKPGGGNGQTP